MDSAVIAYGQISILAPSRERLDSMVGLTDRVIFQSSLPHGSDLDEAKQQEILDISILAPSRERRQRAAYNFHGTINFNPRSLTGATASKQITSLFI